VGPGAEAIRRRFHHPETDAEQAGPGRGWIPDVSTETSGIDRDALAAAVDGATARESVGPRDMRGYLGAILADQQANDVVGPLLDGSGPSGVVVHGDQVVAEWGAPAVPEMSFSATKSYLSLVAGLAFDRGLLANLDEPVVARVDHDAFAGPRDRAITWTHLLQQTSQWDGTLWDKPWWCDPQGGQAADADLGAPGSAFAYNDVRINLLALALTVLWRRPLDEILREELMGPIGAPDGWEWHGYDASTVVLDGHELAVVSGGAHWGGGMWMCATDHARVGRLVLHRGVWDGRRVLSEAWLDRSFTPSPRNPDYGLLWWLNHRGRIFGEAPTSGVCARGNLGRQLLWIDPARDIVVVSRWSDGVGRLLAQVSAAVPAA
jgi:CubicO group peptidase (beta-lactamase class C family)